jgi:hypothetical protein
MTRTERKAAVEAAKAKKDAIGWELDHLPFPAPASDPRWADLKAAEDEVNRLTSRAR